MITCKTNNGLLLKQPSTDLSFSFALNILGCRDHYPRISPVLIINSTGSLVSTVVDFVTPGLFYAFASNGGSCGFIGKVQ